MIKLLLQIGGVEVFVRAILFLANIFLARGLPPEQFSFFVLLWSLVQGMWLLTEIGTTVSGMRKVAQNPDNTPVIYREITSIRVFHAIIVSVLFIIAVFLMDWDTGKKIMAVLFCVMYLFFYAPYADWVARGLEDVVWLTRGRVIYAIVCLFISAVVLFTRLDWFAFFMFPAAALAGSVAMIIHNKHSIFIAIIDVKRVGECWWRVVSHTWIYTVGGVLTISLQYIPLWWLDWRGDNAAVQAYAPAFNLLFVLSNVLSIVSLVFIPRLTRYMSSGDREALVLSRRFFYVALVISAFSVWIFYTLPALVLHTFYGDGYIASSGVLHQLSPLALLLALQYVFGSSVTASGWQWVYCVVLFVALVVQYLVLTLLVGLVEPLDVAVFTSIAGFSVLVLGLGLSSFVIAKPLRSVSKLA